MARTTHCFRRRRPSFPFAPPTDRENIVIVGVVDCELCQKEALQSTMTIAQDCKSRVQLPQE